MWRVVAVGFLLGLPGVCFGDEEKGHGIPAAKVHVPEITRQHLLSRGFKKSPDDLRTFLAKKMRLGDAARELGFQLADLYPFPSKPPNYEVIAAMGFEGYLIRISSEVKDASGHGVPGSLKNPNSLCTVSVTFDFAAPDARPRVRIKSVTVTDRRTRGLRVTFELAAVGKTPLAFAQTQFGAFITGGSLQREIVGSDVTFPKNTPKVITVSEAKPVQLMMDISGNFEVAGDRIDLTSLPAGEYGLGVLLFNDPRKTREFEYEYLERFESKGCPIRLE